MAIVKTLDILLRGRTEKLKTDLDKGKAIVTDFSTQIKGIMQNAFTAISTAAIVAKFRSVITALDDLGDRAKVFGVSSAELGGLEFAADLAAVSYDKLAVANKFLLLNIAKANSGVKQSVDLFTKLGTTGDALAKMSMTERLETVARGLTKVGDQAKKTELALKLFGKQGLLLLPLLSRNGKDLTSVLQDLRRYGIIFSSEDTETLGSVNDAFAILGRTFDAVFGRIAVQAAPALRAIAINLTEALKPGTALNGVLRGLGDVMILLLALAGFLAGAVRVLSEVFGSWAGRLVAVVVGTAALIKLGAVLIGVYTKLRALAVALFAVEAARASLSLATAAKVAVAIGVIASVGIAVQKLDAQIAKSSESVAANIGDIFNGVGGIQASAPARINVQSASRGSQEALQQLFGVTVEGPMEKLVDLGNKQLEVQNAIRDGINGVDASLDIDEQGVF